MSCEGSLEGESPARRDGTGLSRERQEGLDLREQA